MATYQSNDYFPEGGNYKAGDIVYSPAGAPVAAWIHTGRDFVPYHKAENEAIGGVTSETDLVTGRLRNQAGGYVTFADAVDNSASGTGEALNDTITSPLEIANCELWLSADSGAVGDDYRTPENGGSVTRWIDNSGNARHATVSAGSPKFSATGGHNGKNGVKFGAGVRMATPAFISSDYGNAITMFIVSAPDAVLHSGLKVKASISTANFWVGNTGTTGNRDITINGLTGFGSVSGDIPSIGGIDYVSVGGSAVRVCTDGFGPFTSTSSSTDSVAISAGSVPFTNGAVTIGGIAGLDTYDWPGTVSEVLVFSRQLSTAELRRIYNYLALKYGVKTLTLIGNSLTSGTGSTTGAAATISASGTNLPCRVFAALNAIFRVRTDAVPGRTAGQIFSESPSFSGVWGDGYGSVSVVWEGTNDQAMYGSAVVAYDRIRRVCLLRKRFGRKVVVGTVLYRFDTGNDTANVGMTDTLNAMIRANYKEFADAIVDYASDQRLSDPNNTTYFADDKCHLRDAGYQVCFDLLAPVVQAL